MARTMLSQDVCPSVCLSVCLSDYLSDRRWYSVETVKHIFKFFSPLGSHVHHSSFFSYQTICQYSNEDSLNEGAECKGVWKHRDFRQISRYILERYSEDRAILTMVDQSYMVYLTAPFSMTLNAPNPYFKVTSFFDAEYLRNGSSMTNICSYN